MVAKGAKDDFEEGLARAPNVVDYITKPFTPEAIAALVTQQVEARRGAAGAGAAAAVDKAATDTETTRPTPTPTGTDGVAAPVEPASSSDEGPAAPMAPAAEGRPPFDELRAEAARRIEAYRQESDKWDLTELVHGAFDDATLEKMFATYLARRRRTARAVADGDALAGDLAAITVSELLSWAQDKAQTGRLQISSGDARVEIYLRRGKIDFATAVGVGEDLLLGRFAVEAGALTPDALTQVLDERARATTKPVLFGTDLVARGLITEAQLKQAMARQIAEVVYETLRWSKGHFSFRALAPNDLPELARDAALAIPVDSLLLEGFRRVDEWSVIEREVDDFDLVFVPNEVRVAEVARGQLTRDEIAVLELVNGRTPVKEIIRSLRLGSFDVSKILYRLLRTKLIRRRVAPTVA